MTRLQSRGRPGTWAPGFGPPSLPFPFDRRASFGQLKRTLSSSGINRATADVNRRWRELSFSNETMSHGMSRSMFFPNAVFHR